MTISDYKKPPTCPNSQDITKIVQKYFKAPTALSHVPQKTWTKTKQFMIKERPDDLWEKHYVRRKENDCRGYQSVIGEKYKAIGDEVILDTCDLVLSAMSKCLDPAIKNLSLFKHWEDDKPEKKHTVILPPIGQTTSKPLVEDDGSKTDTAAIELPEVHNFQEIKQYLDESKSVLRQVYCGLPYEEYIRKRQENINQNKQEQGHTKENDMVLMSLTNLQLGLPDVHIQEEGEEDEVKTCHVIKPKGHGSPGKGRRKSVMIDPHTNRRFSLDPLTQSLMKKELVARRMTLKSPVSEGLPLGTEESYNQLLTIPSGITTKKERLRRDHLDYLQALSMLLTSINNMKTRELKSKTPMKLDAVKALRKEPVVETKTPFVRESRQAYPLGHKQSRSQQQPALHRQVSTGRGMLEQVAGLTGLTSKFKKKSLWSNMPKPQKQYQGPVVETWEDLVNLEEPQKTGDLMLQSKILIKALLWSRRKAITPCVDSSVNSDQEGPEPVPEGQVQSKIRRDLLSADHHRNTGPIHSKKLPLWQLVALDKSTKSFQEKRKEKDTLKPEDIVSNNKKSMLKVKHDLHKELEGELQKIDREKLAVFKLKYGEFHDMSPIFEEHMARLQSCSTGGSTHRNMDITDVPPSRWFEDLEEKTLSIIGYCDEDINKTLQKIGRYSTIDSKTIPSAKAKLCLLLMSLPAYEMFTIPIQRALKFVLEVIFQGEDHLLGEWFQHRKIPYFIKDGIFT
ncbi:uncharacterized protein LOC111120117 [Crassostrea virginica]